MIDTQFDGELLHPQRTENDSNREIYTTIHIYIYIKAAFPIRLIKLYDVVATHTVRRGKWYENIPSQDKNNYESSRNFYICFENLNYMRIKKKFEYKTKSVNIRRIERPDSLWK